MRLADQARLPTQARTLLLDALLVQASVQESEARVIVAQIRRVEDAPVTYDAIVLWCPGCASRENRGGLHMLPVSDTQGKRPVWQWNGSLDAVGLEPSILTKGSEGFVCHSFLRNGQWQFLTDSTHPLAGQTVPMEPLPDWAVLE